MSVNSRHFCGAKSSLLGISAFVLCHKGNMVLVVINVHNDILIHYLILVSCCMVDQTNTDKRTELRQLYFYV